MDVTIAIVSYNTKMLLKRCLDSIVKHTKDISYEIIVVDNRSTDGSLEMLKQRGKEIKVIANRQNNYFAKANNQAFKKTKSRYFLILNPDTYFTDNSVKSLVDYMDTHPEVGIAEGVEYYENGDILTTGSLAASPLIDFFELSVIGKRLAPEGKIKAFRYDHISRKRTFEIESACGAFMIIRTELYRKLHGFDENLLLYYTDNDLCVRTLKEGYKIMHYAGASVVHAVSSSTNKIGWKKLDIYYQDLLTYHRKNGQPVFGLLLAMLLRLEKKALQIFRPQMFS